jgi:hypothetical protein
MVLPAMKANQINTSVVEFRDIKRVWLDLADPEGDDPLAAWPLQYKMEELELYFKGELAPRIPPVVEDKSLKSMPYLVVGDSTLIWLGSGRPYSLPSNLQWVDKGYGKAEKGAQAYNLQAMIWEYTVGPLTPATAGPGRSDPTIIVWALNDLCDGRLAVQGQPEVPVPSGDHGGGCPAAWPGCGCCGWQCRVLEHRRQGSVQR